MIIVSSTSRSAKYVLTGVFASSASCQDARITTGTRTTAIAMSTREMPSTPTAYDTPNCLIHSWCSTSWNWGPSDLKRVAAATVSTSVSTETPSATCLASSSRPRGSDPTTTPPSRGTTPMVVSHGKAVTSDPHQDDGDDQDGRPREHGQGVGTGEPGLHAAAPRGHSTQ